MNPLADVLPAGARKILYAVVFLGLLVFAAINVADGDWSQVVLGVLTSLAPLLAASNVNQPVRPVYNPYDDPEVEDEEEDWDTDQDGPEPLYGTQPPLRQPGSDEDGFGGDAPPSGLPPYV